MCCEKWCAYGHMQIKLLAVALKKRMFGGMGREYTFVFLSTRRVGHLVALHLGHVRIIYIWKQIGFHTHSVGFLAGMGGDGRGALI